MTNAQSIIESIQELPNEYHDELEDFVGYLQQHSILTEEERADPFYCEANMRRIMASIRQSQQGKMTEHDIVEVSDLYGDDEVDDEISDYTDEKNVV